MKEAVLMRTCHIMKRHAVSTPHVERKE